MPTREEIAAWLREAADNFEMIGTEFLGKKTLNEYAEKMRQRAASIKSMRCGTCKYWEPPVGKRNDFCMKVNEVYDMGEDFGCFHHELKEEK